MQMEITRRKVLSERKDRRIRSQITSFWGSKVSQMGSKKLQGLLVFLFFMYLCVFAASSLIIQKGLSSDPSKDVDLGDKNIQHEDGTRNANSKDYTGVGVANGSKIARGSSRGTHAGGSTGSSEHGNSATASNRHPKTHHGAGSCNWNCVGHFTSIFTAVAFLVHLYIEWQS